MFKDYQYQVFSPTSMTEQTGIYPQWVGTLKGLPNYNCSPRVLDDYFLIYVKQGAGCLTSSTQTFQLQKHDFFFLFPGIMHSYHTSKSHLLELIWIGFNGFMANLILNEMGINPRNPILRLKLESYNPIESLMSEMIRFPSPQKAEFELSGRMYQILSRLLENKKNQTSLPVKKKENKHSKPIERALSYIDRNYTSSVSITDLSEYVNLSRTNFSRQFKRETGYSPQDYLINLRLMQAEFLLTTAMPIKDIAHAVGFNDENYFSRCFKMKKHLSPSESREQNRKKQTGKSQMHKAAI